MLEQLSDGYPMKSQTMKRTWFILAGVAGLFFLAAPLWLDCAVKRATHVATHAYTVAEPVPFLTEEVALELARQTLEREGCDPKDWVALRDGRSHSPIGVPDNYLVRDCNNANRGTITFRSQTGEGTRIVTIDLKGNLAICPLTHPK